MTPLTGPKALDQFFLDARARVLDLAATFDRIGRGAAAGAAEADPRFAKLKLALQAVLDTPAGRAEAVQQNFSLAYDPAWPRPDPRI